MGEGILRSLNPPWVVLAGVAAVLLAGCGGGGGGGTGGVASGGTCSAPTGIGACGTCATQGECQACASTLDQAGVAAYNALTDCLFCDACYMACNGRSFPACTSVPSSIDGCDLDTAPTSDCNGCQTCATAGSQTCSSELSACKAIAACVDLVKHLYDVCSPLSM
jgi:hypothetical protein